MSRPTVLTIVLNWRTAAMTLEAVAAALREMDGIDGAITVVDNDSGDGSFETISAEVAARGWDRVSVLQSGRNGGFGAGNNVGIRAGLPGGTKPDYVYILNSDAFPDSGAIRALLTHLESHQQAGFAGSYVHGPDGEPHQTAFRFPSILGAFEAAARFGPVSRLLRKHVITLPVPDTTCHVDWVAGASIMMRRDVLDQIGLFDESFFLYFEETDLCRRAQAAGWNTDYVRDSSVTHIGSVSTGGKTWQRTPRYWFDSRLHYFTKNHGGWYAALATIAEAAGGLLWRARLLVQRKERGDPPFYLRDLIAHGLSTLVRGGVTRTGAGHKGPAARARGQTSP